MFKDAFENVIGYLKEGGRIVIQGSLGEHIYSIGSAIFPAMTADEAMIMEIFQNLQFRVLKWELSKSNLTTHYFCILKKS